MKRVEKEMCRVWLIAMRCPASRVSGKMAYVFAHRGLIISCTSYFEREVVALYTMKLVVKLFLGEITKFTLEIKRTYDLVKMSL